MGRGAAPWGIFFFCLFLCCYKTRKSLFRLMLIHHDVDTPLQYSKVRETPGHQHSRGRSTILESGFGKSVDTP